ncbi:MAG: ribonuclease HIII [Candidatus Izemoplasmatales bacterium]|nr:ribonuclease HIII [Candidatus Izemoplasmatales bacterium]
MNYVFTINDKYLEKLREYYKQIQVESDNSTHKYLFKTDKLTITVFYSFKVMFQGEQALEEYNKWAVMLNLDPIEAENTITDYNNQYFSLSVIGSDEVGTGDFFGPVVVCAAYVSPLDYPFLEDLDIKDSKKLSDKQIRFIGEKLVNHISHHVLVTNNEKYNELIDKGFNMNKIKAYLHNHALKKLIVKHPKYQKIIVDKFCSEENYFKYLNHEETIKDIDFLIQAESVHKAVAVAAIIARYRFLQEFDNLSKEINITLPKGAGPAVDAIGKIIELKYGNEIFRKIAKLNFKNYLRIQEKKN